MRYMKGYKMCVFSILVYVGHGIITGYRKSAETNNAENAERSKPGMRFLYI
jgi:hypothetical protein